MRESQMAALDVLAKSADAYNCWACLDEAVTCGEDDGFTREYIEGEREMLGKSICEALSALKILGAHYGIDVITTTTIKDGTPVLSKEVQA